MRGGGIEVATVHDPFHDVSCGQLTAGRSSGR
jgi:hypothetical protein